MSSAQLTAWLITAVSAPCLTIAGRIAWTDAVAGALLCVAASVCLQRTELPSWVGFFEAAAAILYLGAIAKEGATCWEDCAEPQLLVVALLLTATFAIRKGITQGGRVGASLLWFLAPGAFLILFAGVNELRVPSVHLDKMPDLFEVVPILLLPILGRRAAETGIRKSALIMSAVVSVLILWLNAAGMTGVTNAFYEYSKGVTLFGVAERFEAFSACLLTVGWFALFSYLMGVIFEIIESQRKGSGKIGIWAALAVVIVILYNLTIPLSVVGILCLISWGVLPILTQVLGRLRK